jgi:hypothetical protein
MGRRKAKEMASRNTEHMIESGVREARTLSRGLDELNSARQELIDELMLMGEKLAPLMEEEQPMVAGESGPDDMPSPDSPLIQQLSREITGFREIARGLRYMRNRVQL